MKILKHICILSLHYPTPENPTKYPFVDQLACSFADEGRKVSVISPIPRLKRKAWGYQSSFWQRKTPNGNFVDVYQPDAPSFSVLKLGPVNTGLWTYRSFLNAAQRQIQRMDFPVDALYGHFLAPSGAAAAQLGIRLGVPSFCAFGESRIEVTARMLGMDRLRAELAPLSGIISVSSDNRRVLLENRLCREEQVGVFPNGVNRRLFRPMDRTAARVHLGLPGDGVIGVFTGSFDERKGVLRTQQAALEAGGIKMLYLGGGPQAPEGENVLFKGRVPHAQIPEYLSAADFFVLPTRAEGCCNALVEAMACGLPIISSNGAYNDDILAPDYAMRVDPDDVSGLARAMRTLSQDEALRRQMGCAALAASERLDVDARARAILRFMDERGE